MRNTFSGMRNTFSDLFFPTQAFFTAKDKESKTTVPHVEIRGLGLVFCLCFVTVCLSVCLFLRSLFCPLSICFCLVLSCYESLELFISPSLFLLLYMITLPLVITLVPLPCRHTLLPPQLLSCSSYSFFPRSLSADAAPPSQLRRDAGWL